MLRALPGNTKNPFNKSDILVDPELLQEVQEAADAHGVTVAAWLRHAMRQMTHKRFPPSWHAEAARGGRLRSHDSRLDDETSTKLGTLMQSFDRSAAEIIRQLILQAKLQQFPKSWHRAAAERRVRLVRQRGRDPS